MLFDDKEIEEIEGVEEKEQTVQSQPSIVGEKVAAIVGGWVLRNPETRAVYLSRVVPILDLLAFDDALGSTAIPKLPPVVRLVGGLVAMVGIAIVMRKGEEKKGERSKERVDSRSAGDREEYPHREIYQTFAKEREFNHNVNIRGSLDTQPSERSEDISEPPQSTEDTSNSSEKKESVPSSDGLTGPGDSETGGDSIKDEESNSNPG